jgi:hypothetical protein
MDYVDPSDCTNYDVCPWCGRQFMPGEKTVPVPTDEAFGLGLIPVLPKALYPKAPVHPQCGAELTANLEAIRPLNAEDGKQFIAARNSLMERGRVLCPFPIAIALTKIPDYEISPDVPPPGLAEVRHRREVPHGDDARE